MLHELLELKKPLDGRRHVVSILRRYCDGDLNRHDVERWASLIVSRNDIGYKSDAVVRDYLLELALPANSQLTRERAGKSAVALIEGPTAKAVEAAARVLHHDALRHGWWGNYKRPCDELAATDPIGKLEFDGLVERMLIAAMQAKADDNL
ncbi:hypothetical protein [Bradyrhizobium sp. CCBAU 51765]|uniref:hypothetical protein n=1 Tax=Bradyrhizobium sp. CCBAU 51765 TaxID=1325102 RepID=UPI001887C7FE|nr:hypothetical protein [Bradyrhizobium sp. CCBAU 51765]QOZ11104.1 hypothetical protein XH96_28880 [Bradyrhizobium sp. CCBAU 51765]